MKTSKFKHMFTDQAGVRLAVTLSLIGLLVGLRLIPHSPNFSPLLAVFCALGFWFKKNPLTKSLTLSVSVAVVIGAASDLILGFHSASLFVYAGFAFALTSGRTINGKHWLGSGLLSGIMAGTGFFLISNLGVFLTSGLYPLNSLGFLECYQAAIPFFRSTLASTILYTPVLIYLLETLSRSPSRVYSIG